MQRVRHGMMQGVGMALGRHLWSVLSFVLGCAMLAVGGLAFIGGLRLMAYLTGGR